MGQAGQCHTDKCITPAQSQQPSVTTFVEKVSSKSIGTTDFIGVPPLRYEEEEKEEW